MASHLRPRGVGIPRALRASAMARNVVAPIARNLVDGIAHGDDRRRAESFLNRPAYPEESGLWSENDQTRRNTVLAAWTQFAEAIARTLPCHLQAAVKEFCKANLLLADSARFLPLRAYLPLRYRRPEGVFQTPEISSGDPAASNLFSAKSSGSALVHFRERIPSVCSGRTPSGPIMTGPGRTG
jgi:hypothetical protein